MLGAQKTGKLNFYGIRKSVYMVIFKTFFDGTA